MSAETEELNRRAVELWTDVNEVYKAIPDEDETEKELMRTALSHLITGQLVLYSTTDAFREEQAGDITIEDGAYRFDSIEQMSAYVQRFGPLKDGVPVSVAGERIR